MKDKSIKCALCGVTVYNPANGQKFCKDCAHWRNTTGRPNHQKKPTDTKRKGPSLTEIMHEATKEGLQYAAYCKKHGLK